VTRAACRAPCEAWDPASRVGAGGDIRQSIVRRALGAAGAAALIAWAGGAQAGIIFTPHVSEYSVLAQAPYTEFTTIYTEIEHIYDDQGNKIELGTPFVPAGASTDAALALIKYLWIGNLFRDTDVPILKDRAQFCRVIGFVGYQQNTEQIAGRTRIFGLKPGGNGFGDLFGLCGIYGKHHEWGPLAVNGLLATTVKAPIGSYDSDAALNIGTRYWSYIPQFAFHGELFRRLFVDGSFAYHFHENSRETSFAGLTPSGIADWRTAEINFGWKWTERFFTDIGYSYRESVGPNTYDKVTIANEEPIRADDACRNLALSEELCNSTNRFFVEPTPPGGPFQDRGIHGALLTAGFVYVYRTTSVFGFRVAVPVDGQGSQITVPLDVYNAIPDGDHGYRRGSSRVATSSAKLFGVQEAAAISASPFLELRFVYLFWAP
jgi:hypothetical protein